MNEKGLVLNRQEHLSPVLGLASAGEATLQELVSGQLGVAAEAVVHVDLMLHDTLPPARGGAHDELLFAARLDNLAMCHAGLRAIARVPAEAEGGSIAAVLALFDHEEVGSQSATGAQSYLLPRILERLSRRRGASFDAHARALVGSFCLSADMAHAVHPNYDTRHEPRHKPVLNGGPVLKENAQQRYATSARTAAVGRISAVVWSCRCSGTSPDGPALRERRSARSPRPSSASRPRTSATRCSACTRAARWRDGGPGAHGETVEVLWVEG